MRKGPWPKALFLGILSSLFFSVTYLVNSVMARSGGDWMWSASLRYIWMLPILLLLTFPRSGWRRVAAEIRRAPAPWLLWSLVGFGLFYAPLSFASAYGPSWMVAGTFQFTILAGALETPLFRHPDGSRQKVPIRLLPAFAVMIAGVFLQQLEHVQQNSLGGAALFAIPVLLSAFAYPLGNRKTMLLCAERLSTTERILAMTLCSMPLWLVLAGAAFMRSGLPSPSQAVQSLVVAIFSGLVATIVFFHATQLVRCEPHRLALVESTQCGEVLFSLLGSMVLLQDAWPGWAGWLGLALVTGGMIVNPLLAAEQS